ncbi:MAG: C39 family peptidase [Eubacteriales bacterium]|nr:C39 family peptidase [Eubacteriales bacterium]
MRGKRFVTIMMAALMTFTPIHSLAAEVITPKASLSKKTAVDQYTVSVNGEEGPRDFKVYAQFGTRNPRKSFVAQHGCAASALTCVLSGYKKKYADYTPEKTSKTLERKIFGKRAWQANYRKSLPAQRPVSLYGITKILNQCKVPSTYVRFFKDAQAIREIEEHLKTGNAVLVEVNNHKQKNGVISSRYNYRWSTSKHTLALLGMTDTGQVIVADSADREWSGQKQRVKFTRMKHLVKFMIPCKKSSTSLYYNSVDSCGGYILVNDGKKK